VVAGEIAAGHHMFEYASYGRPAAGERTSGDAAVIDSTGAHLLLAAVDVLGHGDEAHAVADRAESCLRTRWSRDVVSTMLDLHAELEGTRGAVAGICVLELETADLRFCGVGNTDAYTLGPQPTSLYSTEGILGSRIRTPREQRLQLHAGDVLVLHTDGVSGDFRSPSLERGPLGRAADLARRIVNEFGRPYDDATCLVAITLPA
jgi:negative regulator of sigma-B (phosphoserine phosphatase)